MSLVETDIGTIAPDWKVVPLKDVAEKPQYGLTAKAAKSGDTRFLRITDITEQGVNWATVPFCSAPKKKIDPCRLKSGDIVFARIGATTGKSYMITEPPDAVFASYLIRVRASKDLEPGFLIQFFQSRAYWQQVDANKHANLKKGVNGSILSELLLPLPPLPEQKKIAHILSTVQRAIEAQERIIQTTTELKKALMHKLFTEGLRGEPQKQTEIGPIPKSWEVVPLKRVALKPQYGLTAKAAKSGTTKFLRITDITDEGVNWSTVPFCSGPKKKIDACRLKSGDIVFARIGATTGKSYMITDPPDAVFASYLIRVRASESLEPAFLIQFFQSKGYWQQVDANKHANLKKGVNGSILSEMFVPLPTLEAQKEIAAAFMATDQKVRTAAAKRDALKDLFRTLLHELMTAKTRVHEQETTT